MAIDKNAVIKEAQKFVAKGQFDKAIAEWKKIAKESPTDANVFNTIGDLCLKKNSKAEAVDAYQKAADILNADGFTSKAIALYKKVLNIDPRKMEAHLALADLNAEKGLTGNALESYKIVADHYTHNQETKKALGIYQKMADMNASNVGFRIKLADMYAKEGMAKEAVKAYLDAADVHIAKKAFTEARQLFEKALALDANNKDVYHKAGIVFYQEGKFVEACKALKPAFEKDPENAELADMYLDSLAKAGRGSEAAEVYAKRLEKQPDNAELREKLYRLYLSVQDFDRAFAEVSTLVNQKIEQKDMDGAEALLKEFLEQAPRSVEGKQALGALYKTLGKTDDAAMALVQAAAILDEDGDQAGARELAAKAVELAPGLDDARELNDRLQPKSKARPAPIAEETPSPPEPAEPAAGAPEAELEPLLVPPVPEAEPEPEPEYQPAEWAPPAAAAPPEAAAPAPPAEDPSVSAAVTEIDVLVKYGLATKAVEQLEALAQKNPQSIQVRLKLRDLYGDMGNMGKAVSHMLVLAGLYEDQGRHDEAEQVLQAALGMDPNNEELKARLAPSAPAAAEEAVAEEPLPASEQVTEELLFKQPSPELSEPAPEDLSFGQPFEVPDLGFEAPPEEAPVVPAPKSQPAPEPRPAVTPGPPRPPIISQPAPPPPPPPPVMQAAPEPVPAPPVEEVDLNEVWAEAEFYFQQGLFDEARKHYERIIEFAPDHDRAQARLAEIGREQEHAEEFSRLAEAVDELEGMEESFGGAQKSGPPAEEMATTASDEDAVRSLMQEIAQLKQKASPPKPQPVPQPAPQAWQPEPPPARQQMPAAEEDFFDLGAELNQVMNAPGAPPAAAAPARAAGASSDDFFDLASELRDELSSVPVPAAASASPEEQSLDDIFEDFKKGVEQQAIKEDADTHYNLGVAYREMGLLDDAISEFAMTADDEPKFVQSRYMLGLCYMEQGDYENAIIEIRNAMDSADKFGVSAEEHMGMCFDLGLAYQGAGDVRSALGEFQKVYAADSSYRDVAHKIMALQKGGISQQQLKSDIEREISSKFLAEGERIQREEKTRKNERVPRPW